jgi:hypothetical protein
VPDGQRTDGGGFIGLILSQGKSVPGKNTNTGDCINNPQRQYFKTSKLLYL